MEKLIEKYLESKQNAWEQTTLKMETSRLKTHVPDMTKGPEEHYKLLAKTLQPYTIKTLFARLSQFERAMLGTNKYQSFMDLNRRLFKHAYKKKKIEISFEEARKLILAIEDKDVRDKATQLLSTGMRWSESFTLNEQNMVIGKGNKPRRIYNSQDVGFVRSYATFVRKLKDATGLKPHDLRKIYVTHLLCQGLPIHEVKDIVGHSSIETTAIYAQTRKEEVLSDMLRKMVG